MKRNFLLRLLFVSIVLTSCNDDDIKEHDPNEYITLESKLKEDRMQRFSEILSKAVYERKEVREFLKTEALKQFDNDYDVLYYLVKDDNIGNETFREILVNYSSEKEISEIERNVPLLNILIPEISFFDISAENLNINDQEIPVVYSNDAKTVLYFNGKFDLELKKGDVPDFHTFVVNENDRVDATPIQYETTNNSKSSKIQSTQKHIKFLSPYFDGKKQQRTSLNTNSVSRRQLHNIVTESFNYFSENTSEKNNPKSTSYQRDYIYFGIKDKNSKGYLNPNIGEYIDYLTVNPSLYFKLNQTEKTSRQTIKNNIVSNKRKPLSKEELINRMWTQGAYEFKIEIFSESGHGTTLIVPVKPSEIWNFNIQYDRRHGSFWRRSKHTYTIDPKKFTSKVYRIKRRLSIERGWDISNESLDRFIRISEGSLSGLTRQETFSESVTTIAPGKFKEGYKLGIGSRVNSQLGGQGIFSEETTTQNVFSRNFYDNDVVLAKNIRINFYDPVIVKKTRNNYTLFKYGTDAISFCIVPGIQ